MHDGERIFLTDDWPLQVHHTPGHTGGHLSLYDPIHQAAFIGDAILWKGIPYVEKPPTVPSYRDVDAYLNTIRTLTLGGWITYAPAIILTLKNNEIEVFLADSEEFVLRLDDIISTLLQEPGASRDLRSLTEKSIRLLGDNYVFDITSVSTVDAHLQRFLSKVT